MPIRHMIDDTFCDYCIRVKTYFSFVGDCSRHGYGTSSMRNLLRDVLTDYKIELDSRIYGNMSPRSYYYRQYDGNTKWCFDSCLMYGLRQANIKRLSDFTYIAIYDVFSGVRSSNAIKSIVLLSKHHFTLYTIGQA
ncbi:unnamed protein product [Albugo candida]|uniref:Uncharacterized protein n=1 Tax=Albugo candida TaxID=65357 RepID=A0A024GSI4_9STRA|nr:unnamed protein product [Albugo candida]|eukprot:CCI49876.1 unnamed protein product [Albugo candida]